MPVHSSEKFSDEERKQILEDFRNSVNMTPAQLHKWLATSESQRVGQKNGHDESVGHQSGKRIADLLEKKR